MVHWLYIMECKNSYYYVGKRQEYIEDSRKLKMFVVV